MASRRIPPLEDLHRMRRADLQRMAKDHNIKANLKTDMLIRELTAVRTQLASHTSRPPSTNTFRFSQHDDIEERKPTPKSPSSSDLSSLPEEITATAPMRKQNHTLASSSGSRIPISAPRVVSKPMIPPGVVAANPAGFKGKGRAPGNRRDDLTGNSMRSKYRRPEDIKRDYEMEDTAFAQGDGCSVSSASTSRSPRRQTPTYPESTSNWTLDARMKNTEDSLKLLKLAKTKQEDDMTAMRKLLSQAQDNISGLIRENEELRQRLNSVPTVDDISVLFNRLGILETMFQSNRPPAGSISSSDPEPVINLPLVHRPWLETPPGLHPRRETKSDTPTSRNIFDTAERGRPQRFGTSPPRFGRYPLNPASPSPTRQSKRISAANDGDSSASGSQTSLYRSLNPTHGAYPRGGSAQKPRTRGVEPTKCGIRDLLGGGAPSPDGNMTLREDSPPWIVKKEHSDRILGSDLVPTSVFRLADSLPHVIESSPEPPSSYSEAEREGGDVMASTTRSRTKRSALRAGKSTRRSHPYNRPPESFVSVGGGGADEVDAPAPIASGTTAVGPVVLATPAPRRALSMRELFGSTPDLEHIPPIPSGDGIPFLTLGAPREDAETPQPSTPTPYKRSTMPVDETPLVTRTLYGTEFDSVMRAKFSDA